MVDNFGGNDWSGSGWSSKDVFNEINSIPKAKPPQKHSPTRAQPRTQDDLNNVVEGDFYYNNNIENIDKNLENSVPVDDFYYDYNFINFHEDLEVETENDNSGERQEYDSPQEAKPTFSMKDNANMETTRAPAAGPSTFKVSTSSTLKTVDPENTSQDHSESLDEFLSEDFLLPVSTTRSPPLSTTLQSQTQEEGHSNLMWSEELSVTPSQGVTPQDVKWEQDGKQAENKYSDFTEEENPAEDFVVTPKHAAPTPALQTTNRYFSATGSTQETEEDLHLKQIYYEQRTQGPNISAFPERLSPEPSGSLTPEIEVQLSESPSEIPQTTGHSTIFSTSVRLEHSDPTNGDTNTTGESNSRVSEHNLNTTSLPSSETSALIHYPSLLSSGNQGVSDDTTLLTGTEFLPPTNLEGRTPSPPADFKPATLEQIPTKPAFPERTGTHPTSHSTSFIIGDFDYNHIVIPLEVTTSSKSGPALPYWLPTNTATTPQPTAPEPAIVLLPTHSPNLLSPPTPASVQTPTSTQVQTPHWVTGNWSAVSLFLCLPCVCVTV